MDRLCFSPVGAYIYSLKIIMYNTQARIRVITFDNIPKNNPRLSKLHFELTWQIYKFSRF